MYKQPTIIMVICDRIGLGVLACLMLAFPEPVVSQVNESAEKIHGYIQQLDADLYRDREQASASLSTFGIDAVRPLAVKAVTGSPESKWRAKLILETIGVSGNEETFLKTANILKLLYLGASETLNFRIGELQVQWKLEQKRTILNQLRSKGARVVDPLERSREMNDPLGLGAQVFIEVEEPMGSSSLPVQKARFRSANASMKETLNEIDSVMLGSLEENRKRLLKDLPQAASPVPDNPFSDKVDREILLQIELRRRMGVANRAQFGSFEGISITFDEQWKGGEDDLARLHELSEIRAIEIKNIDLSGTQLKLLSNLKSLSSIHIAGEALPTEKFSEFSELKQLSRIQYTNRKIDGKSLSPFRDLNNLTQLVFENCECDPSAFEELTKLRFTLGLAFLSMPIEAELLEAIGKTKAVRLVNLELCKFRIADYRKLRKSRPDIEVNFTPQAMLGVRPSVGQFNGQNTGCEIAQIIPNSGAEKGGMQPRDIVRKVNGQAIEEFEDLRLHVSQHKAGDKLKVTVEREGKEVNLDIQLMPFQMDE